MPIYEVQDQYGRIVKLEGDTPPTDQDLNEVFASLPAPTEPPPSLSPEKFLNDPALGLGVPQDMRTVEATPEPTATEKDQAAIADVYGLMGSPAAPTPPPKDESLSPENIMDTLGQPSLPVIPRKFLPLEDKGLGVQSVEPASPLHSGAIGLENKAIEPETQGEPAMLKTEKPNMDPKTGLLRTKSKEELDAEKAAAAEEERKLNLSTWQKAIDAFKAGEITILKDRIIVEARDRGAPPEEVLKIADEYEAQAAKVQPTNKGIGDFIATTFAGFAPDLSRMFAYSSAGGIAGGVAGLVAGPAAPITTPVLAAMGTTAGTVEYWREKAAAEGYVRSLRAGASNNTAKVVSTVLSVPIGFIYNTQITHLLPKGTESQLARLVTNRMAKHALSYGEHTVVASSMMAAAEAINGARDEAIRLVNADETKTDDYKKAAINVFTNSATSFKESLPAMATLGILGAGYRVIKGKVPETRKAPSEFKAPADIQTEDTFAGLQREGIKRIEILQEAKRRGEPLSERMPKMQPETPDVIPLGDNTPEAKKASLKDMGLTPGQYLDRIAEDNTFFKFADLPEIDKVAVIAELKTREQAVEAKAPEAPKIAEDPKVETAPAKAEAPVETPLPVAETPKEQAPAADLTPVDKANLLTAAEQEREPIPEPAKERDTTPAPDNITEKPESGLTREEEALLGLTAEEKAAIAEGDKIGPAEPAVEPLNVSKMGGVKKKTTKQQAESKVKTAERIDNHKRAVELGYEPRSHTSKEMGWSDIKTAEDAAKANKIAKGISDAFSNKEIWEPEQIATAVKAYDEATTEILSKAGKSLKKGRRWMVDDYEVTRKRNALVDALRNDGFEKDGTPLYLSGLEDPMLEKQREKAAKRRAKLKKENPSGSIEDDFDEEAYDKMLADKFGIVSQTNERTGAQMISGGKKQLKKKYGDDAMLSKATDKAKPVGQRPAPADRAPVTLKEVTKGVLADYFEGVHPDKLQVYSASTKLDGRPWEKGDNAEIAVKKGITHVRIRSGLESHKLRKAVTHEVVGHFGLSPVMREDAHLWNIVKKLYDQDKEFYRSNGAEDFLASIEEKHGSYAAAKASKEYADYYDRVRPFRNYAKDYDIGIREKDPMAEDRMIDEWIAHQSELYDAGNRGKVPTSVVALVKAYIKRMLAKLGIGEARQEEIDAIMRSALRSMKRGHRERMIRGTSKSTELAKEKVPIYYSALQRTFENAPPKLDNMTGKQWEQWLDANKGKVGVKADEIEFSGIREVFEIAKDAKISKEIIVNFLKGGRTEIIKGNSDPIKIKWEDRETKSVLRDADGAPLGPETVKEFTGPDGEKWRAYQDYDPGGLYEQLFNDRGPLYELYVGEGDPPIKGRIPLDEVESIIRKEYEGRSATALSGGVKVVDEAFGAAYPKEELGDMTYTREPNHETHQLPGPKEGYGELAITLPGIEKFSVAGHLGDTPNILVHIRFNTRIDADGKKVLFLEELQSDWGQKRRKYEKALEKYNSVGRQEMEEYNRLVEESKAMDNKYEVAANALDNLEKIKRDMETPVYRGPDIPIEAVETYIEVFKGKAKSASLVSNKAASEYDNIVFMLTNLEDRMRRDRSSFGPVISTMASRGYSKEDVVSLFRAMNLEQTTMKPSPGLEKSIIDAHGSMMDALNNLKDAEVKVNAFVRTNPAVKMARPKDIADAPFIKDSKAYTALALKRAIRYAAENGFDRIAWTTGEQQVNRWSDATREVVKKITWEPAEREDGAVTLELHTKNGDSFHILTDATGVIVDAEISQWKGKHLSELLANKELAAKIMSERSGEIADKGLTVGGKGFIDTYGDGQGNNSTGAPAMITQVANDVIRKLGGGKTGSTMIETKEAPPGLPNKPETKTPQPAFDITPAMRDKVLYEGQTLFSKEAEGPKAPEPPKKNPLDAMREHVYGLPAKIEPKGETEIFDSFQAPAETVVQLIQRKIQDELGRLGVVQGAIEKERPIDRAANTRLKQMVWQGKTGQEVRDFGKTYLTPLKEAIKRSGLNMREIGLWLYARHAVERNDRIAEINPKFAEKVEYNGRLERMPGSGMFDSDAYKIVKLFNDRGKARDLMAIEQQLRKINNYHQNLLVKKGLLGQDMIDKWNSTYKYYVPLKGFQAEELALKGLSPEEIKEMQSDFHPTGGAKGFSISYKTKRALGRSSMADADNIVSNILTQVERDIITGGKNAVSQSLLRLVRSNPNSKVWRIIDVPTKEAYNERLNKVVRVPDPKYRDAKDIIIVREGGKDVAIEILDPAMVSGLKNMGAENLKGALGQIVRVTGNVNRFLSSVITRYSPEFPISNFFRDLGEAMINISSEDRAVMAKRTALAIPQAIKGMYGFLKGREGTEWEKWAAEFSREGGRVDYLNFGNLEDTQKRLISEINSMGDSKYENLKKYVFGVRDFVENTNASVENGVRLSFYRTLRKSGMDAEMAAAKAKNLTVNFNKKGEWGSMFNSLFLFANAAMQGNARMFEVMKTTKGKAATVALTGLGASMANMNRAIAGDEAYEKIPLWTRAHNLIVMRPDGTWYKLPLPYNIGVFYGTGVIVNAMFRKNISTKDGAATIVSNIVDSFNPLGGGTLLQTVSPTAIRWFTDMKLNKDFAGNPIHPDTPLWDRWTPNSQLKYESVSKPSKAIAEKLNEITGGSSFSKGFIDVSPENIDYLVKYAAGGVGDLLLKAASTTGKLAKGEPVNPSEVPFVRKFRGAPKEGAGVSAVYKKFDEMDAVHAEWQHLQKKDQAAAKKFKDEHNNIIVAYNVTNTTKEMLALWSKQRKEANANGDKERSDKLKKMSADKVEWWTKKMKELGTDKIIER